MYNVKEVEAKWKLKWESSKKRADNKPKYYCLDMFPYPSGEGLHVGHWRGYVLSDVLSRYKMLQGYDVLHPMGWDAFGLPAENNAIKKGIHPSISTEENINTFKRQLREIGAVYDWDKEINTTDPTYYKWTQWIFARMFEKGLAYEKEMPLNWCPTCKVVLANEEALGGVCERCQNPATKKNLRQWMLKITEYAERLLIDVWDLDWPEKVKKMQEDWIGRSYGAEIDFVIDTKPVDDDDLHYIRIYTTRPDTLFGATFMVVAPEHMVIPKLVTPENEEAVDEYIKYASTRSSVDRMADKEKTGVFTGTYAVNPLNNVRMPIWVADYVLADYGTGAIMCVPAHDERDFEFAQKFDLPIVSVIGDDGYLINSSNFNGLDMITAQLYICRALETSEVCKKTTNYKLRDWVFSRQRYWGEPIPIIHCADCGAVLVPDEDLPVQLPEVDSYQPTDTGESPLALVEQWVNAPCPKCNKPAKRETNTMPQWAGSSWYFLRYADVNNTEALIGKEALDWLPVDYYVGGVEHAVLHLLYARFYTKFLYDIGVVNFKEPFKKLFNQGMVNKDGRKMSKSAGNGVSPDDLLPKYGCDALRMYQMFIAPPELDCEWDDNSIEGVYRYLNKLWRLVESSCPNNFVEATPELEYARHKMIYDITQRLENLSMNTAISGFMEHTNSLIDIAKTLGGIDKETLEALAILIAPFAPHMAEEIWERLGYTETIFEQTWVKYDKSKLKSKTIEIAIQINGKLRGSMSIPNKKKLDKEDVFNKAKEVLGDKLGDGEIVKSIYVPLKIVNFVVK